MAGWRARVKAAFSPKVIVEKQLGPNTFRYEATKNADAVTKVNEEEDKVADKIWGLKRRGELDEEIYPTHSKYGANQAKAVNGNLRTAPSTNSVHGQIRSSYDSYYGYNSGAGYGGNYGSGYGRQEIGFGRKKNKWEKKANANSEVNAYAFNATRWSSWTFNNSYYNDADDTNLFVKSAENYLTPTSDQIKAKSSLWTNTDLARVKEFARVCYLKMINDKEFVAEMYADKSNCNISSELWDKKYKMFEEVYDNYVPGHTPLEQALALNQRVVDAETKRSTGGGNSNYNFTFKRSDYADPDINDQLNMNRLSKGRQVEILNKISIIGELGSQFKVEKEVGETEVAYSDLHKSKMMNDYSQLSRVELYQRVLPTYRSRFLTKDLSIKVPVQTSEQKQKIIILCDYSGSMDHIEKQIWVNAILIDRFKYVMKGEAEVYFSFFVSNPRDLHFIHVKDSKDVDKFWKQHSNHPNGSYTDMGRIVNYVSDEIKRGRMHNLKLDLSKEMPEILIVNDGQDRVGHSEFPYKVNAISLMDFSEELKDLCIATGGKQVRITKENSIYSYTNEGMQVINE